MHIKICIILMTIVPFAFAQNPSIPSAELPSQLKMDLMAVRDAALQDDYAYKQVAYLCDNIGPRSAGSPSPKPQSSM